MTRSALLPFLLALPLVASDGTLSAEDGFEPLFDGVTLDGWEKHGGKATYEATGGMIVGTSVPNTPNTFLCTKQHYGDFVLEYEFQVDAALNSGVQIRSRVFDEPTEIPLGNGKTKKMDAGRVHGYQVEIDGNKPDRMWAIGIYDEARRGWLFPGPKGGDAKAFTKQGQRLFDKQGWNKVRVEAKGAHIKTFLNGELRADFEDDLTPSGLIGLQVHGVGGNKTPLKARWRNLRIKELQ